MLELRYPSKSLTGDWFRTVCGLGIGFGMLLFAPITWWTGIIFGSVSLLFCYFGKRTLEKQLQRIAVSDEGLWVRDLRDRALPWPELTQLRLRFYGSQRQHRKLKAGEETSSGFLEMTVAAGDRRVKFDSTLEGFALLAWRAAGAARAAGIALDPATAGNLLDIGVDPDQDTAPPEMASQWQAVAADRASAGRAVE
ncbi:MAG: hypothetical protein Kilf2KO_30670 [Rhodospirillales bacterium]